MATFTNLPLPSDTLNQNQSGIYIDTGLGVGANTVIPANEFVNKSPNPGVREVKYTKWDS